MGIKTNLVVSAPESVVTSSSGREEIFKTSLTHPLLDGELFFYHGVKDREAKLDSLQSTIASDISNIVRAIDQLQR